MRIKYLMAPDVKRRVEEIVTFLDLSYIDSTSVHCVRSIGSRSKRIIARIHGLGRIWQAALHFVPVYIIEVISERYDKLSKDEKDKILIHELLHIPKGFSGGFRVHKGYIDQNKVNNLYKTLKNVSL
jgi:predicted metallopeptidase